MPYQAEISRVNPTAFLFLIDQSGSMSDKMANTPGQSKAEKLADVINRTLANLIVRCTKSEGTRDYFDIGILGYNGNGVQSAFQGNLAGQVLNPISKIEESPVRVEDRTRKMDDGAGGILEQKIKFPVWVDPVAYGGTPMREMLMKAAEEIAAWCDKHPNSYPPTILHITDGESTDGDTEEMARTMAELHTSDGNLLLFNLHLADAGNPFYFPRSEDDLPDRYAKMLFRMSSRLPPHLVKYAKERNTTANEDSRGFIFNGDAISLVEFFDIGTRASQMR